MKRIFTLIVLLSLCVSMAGCKVMDYAKAAGHYKKEEYAQAAELYQALGDYADSEKMVLLCNQKLNYGTAERLFSLGQYEEALPLYEGLTMYADSAAKAITCRYKLGVQCFDEEDYEGAISWLAPLGSYEDSEEKVDFARWQWLRQEEHVYVIEQTPEAYRVLLAGPAEEEKLYLYLVNGGTMLGIDYDLEFALILEKDQDEADFWVRYESVGETGIEEKAGGTVLLKDFCSGETLQTTYFFQQIDAWGEQYDSDNAADSTVLLSMLSDAQEQVLTYLPELLKETGVDISPEDLGL